MKAPKPAVEIPHSSGVVDMVFPLEGVAELAFRPKCRVVACHDREEDVMCQQFVAVATGRDRTLAQFSPVLQPPPSHRVSGVWTLAFGEARVAADAIGSLADIYRSALRSCAWKQSINKHPTPLCGIDFDYISYTLGNGGYARLTQG